MPLNKNEPVFIEEYNEAWPKYFQALKQVLQEAVGESVLAIEHVGSTSVPGLPAKPIIDLDLVIESYAGLAEVVQALEKLGYVHQGDLGVPGREAFHRKDASVPWDDRTQVWPDHHMYVCPKDSQQLAQHLAFRNYLRENFEAMQAYGELKRELSEKYKQDRLGYSEAKTEFVLRILAKAME